MSSARASKKRGFTLTEILIVAVVLAAVAALAIPGFQRTLEVTRANEAKVNLEIIDAAERVFYLHNGNRFWPNPVGTATGAAAINTGLNTDISDPNYAITIVSTAISYRATASRAPRRAGSTKTFFINRAPAATPARTDDFPNGTGNY